ncbi:hypothetical protein HPB50_008405 [Hyalomma asiaticum]|uniref:Uncharacterized protein n=1 Tax=Hyalomma asiaticum TaxID=266040 RepID=A0ACB7RML6_HYAAI|nr:hypothetical protein HPB50_008405 [Hyalomma asiaticum]
MTSIVSSSAVKSNEDCRDARDVASRDSCPARGFPGASSTLCSPIESRHLGPPESSCQERRRRWSASFHQEPRPLWTLQPALFPRPRKRKVKAKLTFGSTSTGNSSLPYYLQASLKDIITLLETAQKGEGDEHQSDLTINESKRLGQLRRQWSDRSAKLNRPVEPGPFWSSTVGQLRPKDRGTSACCKR